MPQHSPLNVCLRVNNRSNAIVEGYNRSKNDRGVHTVQRGINDLLITPRPQNGTKKGIFMALSQSQTANLRKLLRQYCLARYPYCLKCGSVLSLETSHIYPKGSHPNMQYDPENVITLCGYGSTYDCHHRFWHAQPEAAWLWLKETLPTEQLTYLHNQSNTYKKTQKYQEIREKLLENLYKYAI